MNDVNNQQQRRAESLAKVSFYMGISSLLVLLASIVIGLTVESIGMVSFFGFVSVLGLAAIVCGFMAKNQLAQEHANGLKEAKLGLIFGAIALSLTIILRISIFVYFIPWLGA